MNKEILMELRSKKKMCTGGGSRDRKSRRDVEMLSECGGDCSWLYQL